MPPVVRELARFAQDGSTRAGLLATAAVGYELLVIAEGGGLVQAVVVAPLAVSLVLVRRRPGLALALGWAALVLALVRFWTWTGAVSPLLSYLAVLVPITAGAFNARRGIRIGAGALAAAATLLVTVWSVQSGVIYGRPALVVAVAVLCGAPFLVATLWATPAVRQHLERFVRGRVLSVDTASPAFWWVALGATAFWFTCVLLDVSGGALGTVVSAAPLAASIVWSRSRPDVALVLASLGLLLTGLLVPFQDHPGAGATFAAASATVAIHAAVATGTVALRRTSAVLVAATALVGSVLAASLWVGVVVLAIGSIPFVVALGWRHRRATAGLRVRLRESERRGRVAERGVQVEQERNRIAREVHDVVAHSLAVVIAQADGARFAAETQPTSVAPALEAIADTARAALGEVRTMLHDLRTVGHDGVVPGPEDIDAVLATVRALGIEVESVTFGRKRDLTEDAGLAMFRIAQEAMTNALRHGDRGRPITVEIDWGEQAVVLAVTNDLPADALAATERPGHGIPGMIERAALVGGECTAGPGSNGRFRVRVTLPVLPTPDPQAEDEVSDALAQLLAVGSRAS